MKQALCIIDNKLYSAMEFSLLTNKEISNKRHDLQCVSCLAEAYYTKGVHDRLPFFGSRNHHANCNQSSRDSQHDILRETIVADRIIVRLGSPEPADTETKPAPRGTSKSRTAIKLSGSVNSEGKTVNRGLDALLDALISTPDFQASSRSIVVNNIETPASKFFVQIKDIGSKHAGVYRGFWGQIYSGANGNSGWTWLNNDKLTAAIGIPQELYEQAREKFHFNTAKDLANAYVLVLGKFSSGLKCMLTDLDHIVIRPS